MISIFNGRRRQLGGDGAEVDIHVQISVALRKHLHFFKGAPLGVFLAIALHSDADGWAAPSVQLLADETGYNVQTVSTALTKIEAIRIHGHRVLLAVQQRDADHRFVKNRYRLFPSETEVAEWEQALRRPRAPSMDFILTALITADPAHFAPSVDFPSTEEPCSENPSTENMYGRRTTSKENHFQEDPSSSAPSAQTSDDDDGPTPTEIYLLTQGFHPTTAKEFSAWPAEPIRKYVDSVLGNGTNHGMIVKTLRRLGAPWLVNGNLATNPWETYARNSFYRLGSDMTGIDPDSP